MTLDRAFITFQKIIINMSLAQSTNILLNFHVAPIFCSLAVFISGEIEYANIRNYNLQKWNDSEYYAFTQDSYRLYIKFSSVWH